MNGFTEYQASGASDTSGHRAVVLTWATAQSMLPLVRHIVTEILEHNERLVQLRTDKNELDRKRMALAWPERRRRYQLGEEISRLERRLQEVRNELVSLGVVLVMPVWGQVGFPTIVNNRSAFFSWRPGEDGVEHWHFMDNSHRRPVPASWKEPEQNPPPKLPRRPRRKHGKV